MRPNGPTHPFIQPKEREERERSSAGLRIRQHIAIEVFKSMIHGLPPHVYDAISSHRLRKLAGQSIVAADAFIDMYNDEELLERGMGKENE